MNLSADQIFTVADRAFRDLRRDASWFFNRVNWSEPFIVALILFHATMLTAALIYRKNHNVLFALLTLCAAIVLNAQQLNEYGRVYWSKFSSQLYFDRNGIFISVMLSLPLVLTSLVISILFVMRASSMLIQVKRKQLQSTVKKQQ
ncbi:hypothetical protein MIR68_002070 [Amoeboaphelidium protococcarum]|nr:hypothetical protein MIR68_002070 [Amoeboaphelidium protococcarum]